MDNSIWFALIFGLIASVQSTSNLTHKLRLETVYLDSIRSRIDGVNRAPQFYFKYQTDRAFELNRQSLTFIKIPGLQLVFNHARPRLYKIYFQGAMYTTSLDARTHIRMMIDDQVLTGNKLYPNTNSRFNMFPELGYDPMAIDWRAGLYAYSSSSVVVVPAMKREVVYVPGGTHVIEMGMRVEKSGAVHSGELSVEIIELDEQSATNLPLLTSSN